MIFKRWLVSSLCFASTYLPWGGDANSFFQKIVKQAFTLRDKFITDGLTSMDTFDCVR